MLRFLLVLLLTALGARFTWAQSIQPFEVEVNVGLTYPLNPFRKATPDFGSAFGLEMRHNIAYSNFDVGMKLIDITTAVYEFDGDSKPDALTTHSNRTISLMLVGDCNFRPATNINPFVGVGLGLGRTEAMSRIEETPAGEGYVAQLRGGVELWYHLRLGGQITLGRPGFSNAALTLGFVVGGRPTRNKITR